MQKLLYSDICNAAREAGLDACSVITRLHRQEDDASFMDQWIAQNHHGQMHYLERHREERYDPSVLVPGAYSMIIGLVTYAHSGHDYHRSVKSKLYTLEGILKSRYGDDVVSDRQHIFCDSAPMLERCWAVEAGLGWIGKNHQLIHPTLGSLIHPGELVLQSEIDMEGYTIQKVSDQCGDCSWCIDACPSGALRNEVWHAPDCIAYTTHHCLACQSCCPFNQKISI